MAGQVDHNGSVHNKEPSDYAALTAEGGGTGEGHPDKPSSDSNVSINDGTIAAILLELNMVHIFQTGCLICLVFLNIVQCVCLI